MGLSYEPQYFRVPVPGNAMMNPTLEKTHNNRDT